MRVLITISDPDYDYGGVANYYSVLKTHWKKSVEYFVVGGRIKERSIFKKIKRVVNDYINFNSKLNDHNYDIVQINPSLSPRSLLRDAILIILANRKNIRTVVFFRGWDVQYELSLRRSPLIEMIFKKAFFRATAIVVLAKSFEISLREMGYSGTMFVETTTIDDVDVDWPALFNGINDNSTKKDLQLLFLARIEKSKGIYIALDAHRHLESDNIPTKLVIAGDGPELDNAKKWAKRIGLKKVDFLGYIRGEEKRKHLRQSDVLLFPTCHGEGMPNAVLEAMGNGLAIVSRPMGGIKDFFKEGEMGFISDSTDPKLYALMVKNIVLDRSRLKKMQKYNAVFAYDNFRASVVADRMEKIWEIASNEQEHKDGLLVSHVWNEKKLGAQNVKV